MDEKTNRTQYRYSVDLQAAELTPLASVHVYVGEKTIRVLNISQGGLALLLESEDSHFVVGDIRDVSVEVRGRSFHAQLEIKNIKGLRLNRQFVEASPAFLGALKEFLQPKYFGGTLKKNESLTGLPEVKSLVSGAQHYEAYTGQNNTGIFIWLDFDRHVLKLIAFNQNLVLEWTLEQGLKTGHKQDGVDDIAWDRAPDATIVNYFIDIFLAWLPVGDGSRFAESLMARADPTKKVEGHLSLPTV